MKRSPVRTADTAGIVAVLFGSSASFALAVPAPHRDFAAGSSTSASTASASSTVSDIHLPIFSG
jgi:hypothetical protein